MDCGSKRQWVLDGLSDKTGTHVFLHKDDVTTREVQITVADYFRKYKQARCARIRATLFACFILG